MTWPIVTLAIESENDVVVVRQRARRIAELLGFERQDQTRIATAVSEIARNAFAYAKGGRAEFRVLSTDRPQRFRILITDTGNGIPDLQHILDGQYSSQSGMGLGLMGARRLMEQFKIETGPRGTTVDMAHSLPRRAEPVDQAKVTQIVAMLRHENAADPLEALRDQNRELLASLDEIRRRDAESEQLNKELGDTNRGVVALYAELDERAEQLRKASDLKTRFLSNMSHEFRTPLNSIMALSRLLLDHMDGALNPEQERQVGYIRRSAESLLELVNDLLDLAKVEAGKVDVKTSRFTVAGLFGALRGALRPLRRDTAVDLIFEMADNLPELETDEAKVSQVLRNLISNALKFTEQGEVHVSATYDADTGMMTFAVRDTGIGIATEDLCRIFEEFSQVDTGIHRKVKGTGLGLPLSRSLGELLGGTIHVESVPGQGSIFTFSLPAVFGRTDSPAPRTDSDTKRVLLIDDDETFRYVVKQIIRNESSYELIEANDGEEGLRYARDSRPDVILLDLQMPNVDGFTVLQELGMDDRTRSIPVIISTSLAANTDLRSRLPVGIPLLSKNMISRETVARFLHDAMQGGDSA